MTVLGIDNQLMMNSHRSQSIAQHFRLVHRYDLILLAMQDQSWHRPSGAFTEQIEELWIGIAFGVEYLAHPIARRIAVEPAEIVGAGVKHRSARSSNFVQQRSGNDSAARHSVEKHLALIHPLESFGDRYTILNNPPSAIFHRASGCIAGAVTWKRNGQAGEADLTRKGLGGREYLFGASACEAVTVDKNQQRERPVTRRAHDVSFDISAGAGIKETNGLARLNGAELFIRDDSSAMTTR